MPTNQNSTKYLNGLRGCAALIVVLSHFSEYGASPLFINFAWFGKSGVYLFFALSSFLLTRQFLASNETNKFSAGSLSKYFSRRFFRIFPLFFLVLITSYITTKTLGSYTTGKGFPFTITWTDLISHLSLQSGTEVLWSIPVEIKFYFLLPMVAWVYIKSKSLSFNIISTLILIGATSLIFPISSMIGNSVSLCYYLPIFLLGSLSASICHHTTALKNKKITDIIVFTSLILIVLTLPQIFGVIAPSIDQHKTSRWGVLYGLLWCSLITTLYWSDNWLKSILSGSTLEFFGKISFSLYLLHYPIIKIAAKFFPGNIFAAWIAFFVCLIVSTVSYHLIENGSFEIGCRKAAQRLQQKKWLCRN